MDPYERLIQLSDQIRNADTSEGIAAYISQVGHLVAGLIEEKRLAPHWSNDKDKEEFESLLRKRRELSKTESLWKPHKDTQWGFCEADVVAMKLFEVMMYRWLIEVAEPGAIRTQPYQRLSFQLSGIALNMHGESTEEYQKRKAKMTDKEFADYVHEMSKSRDGDRRPNVAVLKGIRPPDSDTYADACRVLADMLECGGNDGDVENRSRANRDLEHAADCSWIKMRGKQFEFARGQQRAVIKELVDDFKRNGGGVSVEVLEHAANPSGNSFALSHVFRLDGGRAGKHPAWNTIIIRIRQGVYQLVVPIRKKAK